jgi:hypothetical protein
MQELGSEQPSWMQKVLQFFLLHATIRHRCAERRPEGCLFKHHQGACSMKKIFASLIAFLFVLSVSSFAADKKAEPVKKGEAKKEEVKKGEVKKAEAQQKKEVKKEAKAEARDAKKDEKQTAGDVKKESKDAKKDEKKAEAKKTESKKEDPKKAKK